MSEPFLSNLGVTSLQQARPPEGSTFPLAFNPNNVSVWEAAVLSIDPSGEAATDWVLAVRAYVDLCEKRGVFPFQNVHLDRNDQISDYLKDRRKSFVEFCESVEFFADVKVRDTERKVTMTDSGFMLKGIAIVHISDPSYEQWLTQKPAFQKMESRFSRSLMSGLSVFAEPKEAGNWELGYEISCPMYPDVPDSPLPSRANLESFVLSVLWMPVLRCTRPSNLAHRLI
jgi:hypothetical protein